MANVHTNEKPSDRLQFSLRALLLVTCVASIAMGIFAYIHQANTRREAELARLARVDAQTLDQLIAEVAACRNKLGRAPHDQAELEQLLGRKLPAVHDMGHPIPIRHYQKGQQRYLLIYTSWATDDWVFDSSRPSAGWVQQYY